MDKQTGMLYPENEMVPQGVDGLRERMPDEWPRFAIGDRCLVNGVGFVVQRINRTGIVLRAAATLKESSARRIMDELQRIRRSQ